VQFWLWLRISVCGEIEPDPERSADLQSAVPPIFNRQAGKGDVASELENPRVSAALQFEKLRYSRLQICVT
jgi:hypothetical protein